MSFYFIEAYIMVVVQDAVKTTLLKLKKTRAEKEKSKQKKQKKNQSKVAKQ